MSVQVELKRRGEEISVSLKMTLPRGTPMLECEELIRQGLDEAGRLTTGECLRNFDADGGPLVVGGTKLTTKGQFEKAYQTPYGEIPVERHIYQSSDGGKTYCPLDEQARIIGSTTPRFARMCSFKYAAMSSTLACQDLKENHGREISRCYLHTKGVRP